MMSTNWSVRHVRRSRAQPLTLAQDALDYLCLFFMFFLFFEAPRRAFLLSDRALVWEIYPTSCVSSLSSPAVGRLW